MVRNTVYKYILQVLVVYATETGTAKRLASKLRDVLRFKYRVKMVDAGEDIVMETIEEGEILQQHSYFSHENLF